MAKNIVVCIDGTSQGFGSSKHPSNVEKLFNMVEDRCSEQVTFYDKGVGTHQLDLLGKVTGTGMSGKIQRAYRQQQISSIPELLLWHYRGDGLNLNRSGRGAQGETDFRLQSGAGAR